MAQSRPYIHKSHIISEFLYHYVCPAKYRRVILSDAVGNTLKDMCLEISKRYQIHFLEIGTDENNLYFLVQSIPTYSFTIIVTIIKGITVREVFQINPEVKKKFWEGEFWTDGYFVKTVSKFGDENTISKYVREQGIEKQYKVLHLVRNIKTFRS